MLPVKFREKSIGKMRSMRLLVVLLVTVVLLILGAAASRVWAEQFEDAKIIFETNFSDEDTGIQIFLDGGPWKEVEIVGPNGEILEIEAEGRLRNFGLTEAFFESNEPNWDDVSLEDILARFPEGNYRFKGRTTDGNRLRSRAFLSHDLPCAPDEDSLWPSEETVSANGIVIEWDHVTTKLDIEDEDCGDDPITVVTYQVIVENLDTENQFSIFVEAPPDGHSQVTLPPEFVEDDTTYKWEVLAIAENGNQTIAETWFCTGTASPDCPEPK